MAHRLRALARSEGGFTIIEVVVSAALVIVIAGGVLTGIDAAGRSSADLRHRSQAQELANEDQERMGGMSALQLSGLSETRDVTVDGTTFHITSTGQFLTHTGGGSSCEGQSAADYVKVVSTVTWGPNAGKGGNRKPVVVQSIITPPIGGTMLLRVKDQNDLALAGIAVSAQGPERFSGITDSSGCLIFPAMAVGDYTVSASRVGYVDPDGNPSTSATVRATTSETAVPQLKPLGQAGAINATFTTRVQGTPYTDQRVSALSWFNSGMTVSKSRTFTSDQTAIRSAPGSEMNLFPFATGGSYSNNYSVWGGICSDAKPPDSGITYATVQPGSTANVAVALPALIVNVFYRESGGWSSGTTTTQVTPAHIKLTDACGQSWFPPVRPSAPTSPLGQLNYPGVPYAPSGDRYSVCVDYRPSSSSSYRRATTQTANTDFAAGTRVDLTIDSGSSSSQC